MTLQAFIGLVLVYAAFLAALGISMRQKRLAAQSRLDRPPSKASVLIFLVTGVAWLVGIIWSPQATLLTAAFLIATYGLVGAARRDIVILHRDASTTRCIGPAAVFEGAFQLLFAMLLALFYVVIHLLSSTNA